MQHPLRLLLATPLMLSVLAATAAPVVRRDLLSVAIAPTRTLARVEIKEVTLAPHVAAPLHLHPCPVVGVVLAGRFAFQLEGQPVRELGPGDAFLEPAGARVAHFDNLGDTPATFTACYLLAPEDHELIQPLSR